MSNLNNSLRPDNVSTPAQGWVYASAQYKIFTATPSVVPNSRAKFDRVGHMMMIAINPDWVAMHSNNGEILMVVGSTRWDADSLKQTLEEQCFQAEADDVTYTVAESTGYWAEGNDTITYDGSAYELIVSNTLTYWRDTALLDDVGGTEYYLANNRTNANTPGDTDIPGDEENYWIASDEAILLAESVKTTNWNLGNYQSGRYSEFPLDIAITNGSNLRLYHYDLDEIDEGDWNLITGEPKAGRDFEGSGRNLYDYGEYFDTVIRQLNPMMYVLQRDHSDDTADGVQNRLIVFAENDKFGSGSEYAHAQFIGNIGGELGQFQVGLPETDAGQVIVPIMFRRVAP